MTAPETFTAASKQPFTTGRRPDMAGICANGPAGSTFSDVADSGLGRLNWAETGPTWFASGRIKVSPRAAIRLGARNRLDRPEAGLLVGPEGAQGSFPRQRRRAGCSRRCPAGED